TWYQTRSIERLRKSSTAAGTWAGGSGTGASGGTRTPEALAGSPSHQASRWRVRSVGESEGSGYRASAGVGIPGPTHSGTGSAARREGVRDPPAVVIRMTAG